jgi:hypothetical protein
MKRYLKAPLAVLLGVLLLLAVVTFASEQASTVEAASVSSWYWTSLVDGSTSYDTTQYTPARLSANYAGVQVQATNDISATGTFTLTPQFSLDSSTCAGVSNWFEPKWYELYVTNGTTTTVIPNSGIAEASGNIELVVTNDASEGRAFEVEGTCMRFKMQGSDTYTPTIKARLLNTQ